jgi:hypothetical protein
MGDVDYFLGTAFTWKCHPNNHLSVHLCQSAFTEFTAHRFGIDKYNRTPNMVERLKTFQKDEYFAGANWVKKDPAFQKHSIWIDVNSRMMDLRCSTTY